MTTPSTTAPSVFLDSLRRSNLIEPEVLKTYISRLRQEGGWPEDALGQARKMLSQGKITKYQAEQLLQGKWKNFQVGGKFNVLERLSGGAMSSVFLCEHIIMKRMVTLKFLPDQSTEPTILARFHREARAAARLQHNNVVAVYDVDCAGKLHFLVAEYVDGSNLEHVVGLTGPMDLGRAANYISQAAEGLQHAHENGMVHRDIKPSNFLLDRSGTVKLLDLGLARLFQDETDGMTQLENGRVMLGTIDYLAPEQAVDSHDVDIRADIYGLGATFFFLLTGRTLYEGASSAQKLAMHTQRPTKSTIEEIPGLPKGLGKVLEKMLAKNRASRYQTPSEVVEALAPFVQESIDPPSEEEMPKLCAATRRVIEHSRTGGIRLLPNASNDRGASKFNVRPGSGSRVVRHGGSVLRTVERSTILPRLQANARTSKSRIILSQASPKVWFGIGTGVTTLAVIAMIAWWFGGDTKNANASSPRAVVADSTPSQSNSEFARSEPVDLYKDAMAKLRDHHEAEAANLLRHHMSVTPGAKNSFMMAQMTILDLFAGNGEEHRRGAQEILALFAHTNNPDDAERAVKCCVLSRSPIAIEKARALCQRVIEPDASNPTAGYWYKAIIALVAIRSGELEDALKVLGEGRPQVSSKHPAALCMIDMLSSIAEARLGHSEKAKALLLEASKLLRDSTMDGADMTMNGSWHDWYACVILRQEAESLLNLPPGGPKGS